MVEGCIVDVINMVRVEMERIKTNKITILDPWHNYYPVTPTATRNWSGGIGSGGAGGVNGESPSIDSNIDSPGQWIVQLATSVTNGDGGGGNGGEPTGNYGAIHGGRSRDDKRHEFALVNPRNMNIPIFTSKSINNNPYLPIQ